jgi:tetratricopeptide (TPR) repeat protein
LTSAGRPRQETAVSIGKLMEVGLVLPCEVPSTAPGDPAGTASPRELDVATLEDWLAQADAENFERLLGLQAGATPEQARAAYYQTVRVYHPDRFREGPLSGYYKRVEQAFRVVHEALDVLTDPNARARREREKKRAEARSDPALLVRGLVKQAKRAIAEGRRIDALETLERALATAPGDLDATFARAALLLGNPRRRDESLAAFEELAKQNPARADMLAGYGIALVKCGREDEGRATIGKALQLDPANGVAAAARGDAAVRAKVSEDPLLALLLA